MKVFISGISGTGMGPLALMAHDAGLEVVGSDLTKGAIYDELIAAGITVHIGPQDGAFLQEHMAGLDWFVHTSALSVDHPELAAARAASLRCTKRDDFTAFLVDQLGLKMVAVAGTHGKTTTTAMIVWTALAERLPVSYVVGTTLGFAVSGAYHKGDRYFIYEADEYDRNFLKYHPWLGVITTIDYDHPDVYPTVQDYRAAFEQFKSQCRSVITTEDASATFAANIFRLAGEKRRADASLAAEAVSQIQLDSPSAAPVAKDQIITTLNHFPGIGRRFERLTCNIYTDYAHHPAEIAATIQMAHEKAQLDGLAGVVAIYQPHQNARQHEIKKDYSGTFHGLTHLYWLPTYLVRGEKEQANQGIGAKILTPADLIGELENPAIAEPAELGANLLAAIKDWDERGYLVLLLSAGPADPWLRQNLTSPAS